jgi:hypothetical protein
MGVPRNLEAALSASQSVRVVPVPDSKELVIVFSPRAQGYKQPKRFFLFNEIVEPRFNRLHLRDMNGLWYFKGLDRLGNSLCESIEVLRRVVDEGGFHSVVILGLSSGSHAAFITGTKIPVDAVICVGCRFDLSRETREMSLKAGTEKQTQMEMLWIDPSIDRRYLRARDAADESAATESPVRLYFDPENSTDALHASFVEDLPYVSAIPCRGYGHDIYRLCEEVFRCDPHMAGSARFANRAERLDMKKMAAGAKLASALRARQGVGG